MTKPNPTVEQNVASLMAEVAFRNPDKQALVFENRDQSQSVTFGELWRDASAVAAGLQELGLKQGDRAIIMIPMSIDLYVCLLGLIQMGAVVVFIDPWIGAKQIARFSEFAEPTAFIGINKSHLLRWTSNRLRRIPITATNGFRVGPFLARHSLDQLKRSNTKIGVAAVSPDDTALITFTSGSSGMPKGANRTHRFLMAQHLALKHEFPYAADDVDMPMFPVFALNNLVTGITSVVPEMDFKKVAEVDGNRILEQMIEHRITTCTASPPLLDNLANALEGVGDSLRSKFHLRRVLTGGAPVSDRQLERWSTVLGGSPGAAEVIVAYGSTEAEPVGHIESRERLALSSIGKGFCTGRPTELIKYKVIPIEKGPIELGGRNLNEIELAPGEVGELVVAGDHVCRDYYKNESATRENKLVDANGTIWHRMGDTGYFDEDSRFWLVGRVHSTIFRNGRHVHPQIVEQISKSVCAEIVQVAALGYEEESVGEWVVVLARVNNIDNRLEDGSRIRSLIRDGLAAYDQPCDRIVLTPDPLDVDPRHNSKIDYAKVRLLLPKQPWQESQ